jgi:hypothetical protein
MTNLLIVVLKVDEIMEKHHSLKAHWAIYRRCVRNAQQNLHKYEMDNDEQLMTLQSMLDRIELTLFSGYVFQVGPPVTVRMSRDVCRIVSTNPCSTTTYTRCCRTSRH